MRHRLPILVSLFLTVAACAGDGGVTTPTADPASPTTSPVTTSPVTTSPHTSSPVTTSAPGEVTIDPERVAAPTGVPTVRAGVLRVIDGDSLEVDLGGERTELRLVGINAPEGDECHGDTSRATLEAIVESAGLTIDVAPGDEATDQFGRLLGYVSVQGVDINALLAATGNALALQSGHPRQDRYLELSEAAFVDGTGMWSFGVCGPVTVADGDLRIVAVEPDPPGRDEDRLLDELVVIANASRAGVDLSGWVVRDESTANRYVFPDGTRIAPDGSLEVRTGCAPDDATTLHWCSDVPVWSNGGDTVILLDAAGNVVDLWVYRG